MNEKQNQPPASLAIRCLELRCRSRQGGIPLTEIEFAFCKNMKRSFPEWYKASEREVIQKTFGD